MSNFDYPSTDSEQTANLDELNTMLPDPKSRKTSKKTWIIISLVSLVILCSAVCLTYTYVMRIINLADRGRVSGVLDSYMDDMVNKDAESAFFLFNPKSSDKFSLSKLKEYCHRKDYVLYDGYQRLEINSLEMTMAFNTNPELPQGVVANVKATIYYENGYIGKMEATLEKYYGFWTIYNLDVSVPPDKTVKVNPTL